MENAYLLLIQMFAEILANRNLKSSGSVCVKLYVFLAMIKEVSSDFVHLSR
jgi:hypothetical protein